MTPNSRRYFFKQLVLGSMGLTFFPTLQACFGKDSIKKGTGKPPFSVWEEIIDALEQSPDHLVAQRKSLITAKDPNAMITFVKDSFQTLPRITDFLHDTGRYLIYGTEVALRCGLATPREKAEILKSMLEEAGFEAKVVTEKTELTIEDAKSIVFDSKGAEFNPPIPDAKYREWLKKLGVESASKNLDFIPDSETQANELTDELLNNIQETYFRTQQPSFRFDPGAIPGVVYVIDGEEKFAHIFDPKVPVGQLHPTNTDKTYKDALALPDLKEEDITVTLTCANALNYWEETELISGTWKASQLIGNQIKVQFLNNMNLADQATKDIFQISSFTPSLSLMDLNTDTQYLEENSFLGEPITLEGERVLANASEIINKGNQLAASAREIKSISIEASAKTFPKVRLTLKPLDADGKIIEGLSAANFSFTDNGKPVTGYLFQNKISPRILVMYDTSMSMPTTYRGEGIKNFLNDLKAAIYDQYPTALISLQATGSNIYTSHLNAAQSNNDVIIYATDGHNDDTFKKEYQAIYDSGPPTIYLNVYNDETFFKKLKENMTMMVIPADDQSKTILLLKEYIEGLEYPPYVFTYNSFSEEDEHKIEVTVKEAERSASDTFKFPERDNNITGNRMIGLYLYIKIAQKQPIKRVLAGWDNYLYRDKRGNLEMANQVHEMLLGGLAIAVEREGPTLSLHLSEYLKALMSHRGWFEAWQDGDIDKAAELIQEGTNDYPSPFLTMMQALPNSISNESVTYPTGYRIGILKTKPGIGEGKTQLSFDFLHTSNYQSITRSGEGQIKETLKKTSYLAILEDHVFNTSTRSQLKGKSLVLNRNVANDERYRSQSIGERHKYFYEYVFRGSILKLFDETADVKAYWRIDPTSGELYGVLPDQTGGGENDLETSLEHLNNVVNEYKRVLGGINIGMALAGVGTLPLGIVANYSLTLVRLYALASEALILMDAKFMNDRIAAAMQELACNIYKELVYSSWGSIGSGMSGVENLIAAMGGDFSFIEC